MVIRFQAPGTKTVQGQNKPLKSTTMGPPVFKTLKRDVLFKGQAMMFSQAVGLPGRNLKLQTVTPANRQEIWNLIERFYLNEVNPASKSTLDPANAGYAADKAFEDQGTSILKGHLGVFLANMNQATQKPNVFHVVTDEDTGKVVGTAALMASDINGTHKPPAGAKQICYNYQDSDVREDLGKWLLTDLIAQARAQGADSVYTSSRAKGMDSRNKVIESVGFKPVTSQQRRAELMPPLLRSERNIVYELKLKP